jgi:AraC-like DNA-binding protein
MPALNSTGDYHFILPAPELRRYITTYYFFDIETSDNLPLYDVLHPEWASARYMLQGSIDCSIIPNPPQAVPQASITGPTLRGCNIRCNKAQMAGIGILPLGWHRLIGVDASKRANLGFDVSSDTAFSIFATIWNEIRYLKHYDEIAEIFDKHILPALGAHDARETGIEALHHALTNPDMGGVAQLADSVGMTIQQVERVCRRVFGFPPKRLLRRQRFLRTLGLRLLDPERHWSSAMDIQYHDQAHFTRDFHDFMGMSPRAYLAMPRQISQAAIRARAQALGHPLQVLQRPELKG